MSSFSTQSLTPEDLPPVPRPVRVNATGRRFRWCLLVAGIFVVAVAGYLVVPAMNRSRHIEGCLTTEGYVLTKELVPPQGRHRDFVINFSFRTDPEGPELIVARPVIQDVYNQIEPGQVVPVVYHPSDTQNEVWLFDNKTEREEGYYAQLRLGLVIVSMFIYWGLLEFWMWRECVLAREGTATWCYVLESGERRGGKGGPIHWLWIEFQPADVTWSLNRQITVTKDFREAFGKPGTKLTLLYLPWRPRRNKLASQLWTVEFVQ